MRKAFTLVELMIVVVIIGILAAVAIPKFSDMVKKSKEGATKGELTALRGALQVYYSDNEGNYISVASTTANGTDINNTFSNVMVPKYISAINPAKLPDTSCTDNVATVYHYNDPAANAGSLGGWAYDGTSGDNTWGDLRVNCNAKDLRGNYWTSY